MDKPVVLVTGSTDGLGRAVAHRFAGEGYTVLLHGRSEQRCMDTKKELISQYPSVDIRCYTADFTRLSDIFRLIAQVKERESRLDILINNAGVGIEQQRSVTEDGLELVLQVNYLATYALSLSLMPLLSQKRGRVICVSSSSQATVDFSDPNYENAWNGVEAYAKSKWAQAAFALALARRHNYMGCTIHALHPGSFMPTKLVAGKFPIVDSLGKGVEAVWHLATCARDEFPNGGYIDGIQNAQALPSAYDEYLQEQLILISETMLNSHANRNNGLTWEALRS